MKQILFPLALLCLLSACKDNFHLEGDENVPKIVVYCFPSLTDTTFINVSASSPIKANSNRHDIYSINDANIIYKINDIPQTVSFLGDGNYYVLGSHHAGDKVSMGISAKNFAPVFAKTSMPESTPITINKVIDIKKYDSDYEDVRYFTQLQASFTDDAATKDYYGLIVTNSSYYQSSYGDTISTIKESTVVDLDISDEPVLHPLQDVDNDFGFSRNFINNFYYFNDALFNGKTYTLHLNIPKFSYYGDLQVILYKISPEFYRFLKSINDMNNNDLAQKGFSQIIPTVSNIKGGIGIFAGCNESRSNIIKKESTK
ncbi:MAG TPA: DUF4249 domain-containing protein [Prevotella sp.]|nr:DUF4249 domain-containing protein [Prevotella sp.]